MQWTYGLSNDVGKLHAYMQQHLLMDAYPMAPIPLNDHSIQPSGPVVDQAYFDYAPLFNAMHGAKWLLSTRPVYLGGGANASVSLYTLGGDPVAVLLAPIMLAVPSSMPSVEFYWDSLKNRSTMCPFIESFLGQALLKGRLWSVPAGHRDCCCDTR